MPKKIIKKRVVKAVNKVVKKVAPKKVEKVAAPKVPENSVETEVEVATVEEAPKALPVYNNCQVTKILSTGHTKDDYHCSATQGENVITLHVPKSMF